MSHELRTPLNSIMGYSQLLQPDSSVIAEQKKDLEIIHHSCEHLLNLIVEILDLAKIEAGRLDISPENLPLKDLLDGVMQIMELQATNKNPHFVSEVDNDLPAVSVDEKRLQQILLNLLGNAIRKIRQDPNMEMTPVIAVTAGFAEGNNIRIGKAEFTALVPKPINRDHLLDTTRTLLKLKWTYNSAKSVDKESVRLVVSPPLEELQSLSAFAMAGNIQKIDDWAERIHALDERYHDFF